MVGLNFIDLASMSASKDSAFKRKSGNLENFGLANT